MSSTQRAPIGVIGTGYVGLVTAAGFAELGLNSVIEVNELQKRRVIAKLQKHLGSLVGKEIGLLGLAFKPHTGDMREASSLVLLEPAAVAAAGLSYEGMGRPAVNGGCGAG